MIKKIFFYRQHPEAAIRYNPIVRILKNEGLADRKILEVGSGSIGIAPYLKRKLTGVDISFDEPKHDLLNQIYGSASNLPFKKNQYDVAILSDVLEHIPSKHRKKSLLEAIRVAKHMVIISGPFGKQAFEQDRKLSNYSMEKLDKMHPFFEDHLRYGLPKIGEIKEWLENNQKVKKIKVEGEYFNLKIREILMKIFITNNRLKYYFYLKGLMPLVPLFKHLNKKPCYRTVILIQLK